MTRAGDAGTGVKWHDWCQSPRLKCDGDVSQQHRVFGEVREQIQGLILGLLLKSFLQGLRLLSLPLCLLLGQQLRQSLGESS